MLGGKIFLEKKMSSIQNSQWLVTLIVLDSEVIVFTLGVLVGTIVGIGSGVGDVTGVEVEVGTKVSLGTGMSVDVGAIAACVFAIAV